MTDIEANQGDKTEITPAEGVNDTAITEDVKTENMIPQHRFNEVNDKMKGLADKVSAFEKADADAKTKLLEDQGRYDEILAQKNTEIERLTKVEERFNSWNSERKTELLSQIPEEQRAKFEHLQVEDLQNITKTFVQEQQRAHVDSSRAQARQSGVATPFSAKTKDKDGQKQNWADRLKSYR